MPRRKLYTTLILLVASSAISKADSYGPFRNSRMVETTGRYYLVVTKRPGGPEDPGKGTPVDYAIVERAPGSIPVTRESDGGILDDVKINPEVRVRDGDIVLGRGSLTRCPREILLSSSGLGFVGLDAAGYNYGLRHSGDAVIVVSQDGRVRHRKDLADLFDEAELELFSHTAGGIFWLGGGWLDEKRREVIVVGGRPDARTGLWPLRAVSIDTGKVTRASTNLIVRALADVNIGALDLALGLVEQSKLVEARECLPGLFDNQTLPVETRLRSAVALAAFGDRRGAELMRTAASAAGPGRYYAIRHLPQFFDAKAAPLLRDLYMQLGEEWFLPLWQAMCELKEGSSAKRVGNFGLVFRFLAACTSGF
jgi:hypothetical protein